MSNLNSAKYPITPINPDDLESTYIPNITVYVGTTHVYPVYEAKLARVREHVERLNRRMEKIGADIRLPKIHLQLVGERMVKRDIQVEKNVWRTFNLKFYDVALTAPEKIAFGGWTFVARLQHAHAKNGGNGENGEGGNVSGNIVRVVPGMDLPIHFRFVPPFCDHCRTTRSRKDTFVVVNDLGEYKQVGSSCLGDFLGHNPQAIIGFFEWLDGLEANMASDYGNPSNQPAIDWIDVDEYMPYVAVAIRNYGWVPSTGAEYGKAPTKWTALDLMEPPRDGRPRKADLRVTDEDRKLAAEALGWIRGQDPEKMRNTRNDYMYNLWAACSERFTRSENLGIIASLIRAYKKHLGEEVSRQQKSLSQHIGQIGERLELELTCIECQERGSDSIWQDVVWLHKFLDKAGNIVTWWGSKQVADTGEVVRVRATVKKHTEFKGVKETVVTRLMKKGK